MMAVAGPAAGRIVARHGPRIPLVASGLLVAAGALVLTGLTAGTSYAVLALALVLLGAGQGLVNPRSPSPARAPRTARRSPRRPTGCGGWPWRAGSW
jgi:MFS family permease